MTALLVELGERSYPIHIGAGLLEDSAWLAGVLSARKVAVVSNTTVAPLYAAAVHCPTVRRTRHLRPSRTSSTRSSSIASVATICSSRSAVVSLAI